MHLSTPGKKPTEKFAKDSCSVLPSLVRDGSSNANIKTRTNRLEGTKGLFAVTGARTTAFRFNVNLFILFVLENAIATLSGEFRLRSSWLTKAPRMGVMS